MHLEQSSSLHANYHLFIILIHQPFIAPSVRSKAHDRQSYVKICEESALECSEIVACQARRTLTVMVQQRMAALFCGAFLQMRIWTRLRDDPAADVQALKEGVKKCIFALRNCQDKWVEVSSSSCWTILILVLFLFRWSHGGVYAYVMSSYLPR